MLEIQVICLVILLVLFIRVLVLTKHQRKALLITEIFAKAAILSGKSPWDFFYIYTNQQFLRGKAWDMTTWTFDQAFPHLIATYFSILKVIPEDSLENDLRDIFLRMTSL